MDYSSIPQRHKPSQLAAINSLALYSSFANALVISAPNAQHVSTGQFASAVSYQNRAWCRAEQVRHSLLRTPRLAPLAPASIRAGACGRALFDDLCRHAHPRPHPHPHPYPPLRSQVCYAVKHGAENMYLATSEQHIVPVNQAWLMTSLLVFEGEMTCCLQKHVLNGAEQGARARLLLARL